ncbi:MAG: hypothetical protein AB1810_07415 [Pseudomonadota bacterium]
MDLLDTDGGGLYFQAEMPEGVEALLKMASNNYGRIDAECYLLKAYFIAPANLAVLVAMYRYYYYEHKLDDALRVAERAIEISGRQLSMPADWREVSEADLGAGVIRSINLLRFYLLAIKGAGYLKLRLKRIDEGIAMLRKVCLLDPRDRLGAKALLEIVAQSEYVMPSCAVV